MEQAAAAGGWRKGPWTPQEDKLLFEYITQNGEGRWSSVFKSTGLKRSGKSCRLRWVNYLRPGLKKGQLTPQEEGIIIELHALWGNKWSTIARYLPGRTDNEIKNYWRTHFKSRKPSHPKQEKRRILKQKQQHQQAESIIVNESNDQVGNMSKGDEEMMFPGSDNDEFWSKVYEESASSSISDDVIPLDCYLWGGLWDMEYGHDHLHLPNICTKMPVTQTQDIGIANHYHPFQGDALDYVQSAEIFI